MNVGLNKIAETVGQVEEMQKSLAVKSAELQSKNDMANAKLKQMVSQFALSIVPFFYGLFIYAIVLKHVEYY